MRGKKLVFALLPLVIATACAATVKPVRLTTPAGVPTAVEVVVRVMSQRGIAVAKVNAQTGVIQSDWQATKFPYGIARSGLQAFIVRRFTATVASADKGADVSLRVEDVKCEVERGVWSDADVREKCSPVEVVVGPDQDELDLIGATVAKQLRVAADANGAPAKGR